MLCKSYIVTYLSLILHFEDILTNKLHKMKFVNVSKIFNSPVTSIILSNPLAFLKFCLILLFNAMHNLLSVYLIINN